MSANLCASAYNRRRNKVQIKHGPSQHSKKPCNQSKSGYNANDLYSPAVQRDAWQNGDLLVKSVEEYHAAYMSIHWWPHEFLEKNREVIEQINRRLGYRLQVRELSWPKQIQLGAPLEVRAVCANVGVAPCYPGGYLALTFKNTKGGIVSVHVLDSVNLRDLEVGPPEQAPT